MQVFDVAREQARTGGDCGQPPEVADQPQRVAGADADRRDPDLRCRQGHRQADEVVADRKPLDFLIHAPWRSAAQGLLALQRVGLDLIEGQLVLPAFVIPPAISVA